MAGVETAQPMTKGFRYYSQFRPTETVPLCDGSKLVPAGWAFVRTSRSAYRSSVSYYVPTAGLSAEESRRQFRTWVCFDALAMWTNGAPNFDCGMCEYEPISYHLEHGELGDKDDLYDTVDYSDVSRYLTRSLERAAPIPALSYPDLYGRFLSLPVERRELAEWIISGPPTSGYCTPDAFSSPYWPLLHLMTFIEHCIGQPPRCRYNANCPICGRQIVAHSSVSRREWTEQRLNYFFDNDPVHVEHASATICAALKVRNKLAHGPNFDRSRLQGDHDHLHTETYDGMRAAAEYMNDSHALFALIMSLGTLAQQILISATFDIRIFPPPRPLVVTTLNSSGLV